MYPTGPLTPPGVAAAPQPQGPGPGGTPIAPQEASPDADSFMLEAIRAIVSNARRIGVQYPAALPEVRAINDAVQRLQQKIVQSRPAPEPMAPPV